MDLAWTIELKYLNEGKKTNKKIQSRHIGHYALFLSPSQPTSQNRPQGAQKNEDATHCWTSRPALYKGRVKQPATLGRVNFCQKQPNMPAEIFYCVFGCTDQPQKISA